MKYLLKFLFILLQINLVWSAEIKENSWQDFLIRCLDNYSSYLQNQYSCVCTRLVHHLVNSKVAADENKKKAQLKKLRKHLIKKDWSSEYIWKFINETMTPFIDDYGENFRQNACFVLTQNKINTPGLLEANLEKSWPQCIVCLEADASKLFLPCGHLVYCNDCYGQAEKMKISLLCPLCKDLNSSVKHLSKETIDEFVKFNHEKPNLYFPDCKHLAFYEVFNKNLACTKCHKKNPAQPMRIFAS